jgi:hypothetical protein
MLHLAPHEPTPCPACAAPIATGGIACPACGLSLLVDVTPEGTVVMRSLGRDGAPDQAEDIDREVEAALAQFDHRLTAELDEAMARARRARRRRRAS